MMEPSQLPQQPSQLIGHNCELAQVFSNTSINKKDDHLTLIFVGDILEIPNKLCLSFENKSVTSEQSLANHYEHHQDAAIGSELLPIYNELLKFNIDNKKALNIVYNIAKMGYNHTDIKSIHVLLNNDGSETAAEIYVLAKQDLPEIVKANIHLSNDNALLNETLHARNIFNKHLNNAMCQFVKPIKQKGSNFVEAFDKLTQSSYFRSNMNFRVWLSKMLFIAYAKNKKLDFDIGRYADVITADLEGLKYPGLLKSVILFKQNLHSEAYDQCVNLIDLKTSNKTELIYLFKCTLLLKLWLNVETVAKTLLPKIKSYKAKINLQKYIFKACVKQNKWRCAIRIGNRIPRDLLSLSDMFTLANCYIENGQRPKELMKVIRTKSEIRYKQILSLIFIKKGRYIEAFDVLDKNVIDPMNFYYLGLCKWHSNNLQQCYTFMLQAVVYDPTCADAYHYLGKYYEICENKLSLAIINYEKAYKVDTSDVEAIKCLSDLYMSHCLREENYNLLTSCYRYVKDFSWANFRIGIYYFRCGNWQKAIRFYLLAISQNDDDFKYYEYLAEAYFSQGSYTLALETYNTLIDINYQDYAHYVTRIADTYCQMEKFDEALHYYNHVLLDEPQDFAAIRGLAETWLKRAQHYRKGKLYFNAHRAAQTTIDMVVRALSDTKDHLIYWKILADAIVFITQLPDDYGYIDISFEPDDDVGNLGTLSLKPNMYKLAFYCYWRSKSYLSAEIYKKISQQVALDIFKEEEFSSHFRYHCAPDKKAGMKYKEWIFNSLRFGLKYSMHTQQWL